MVRETLDSIPLTAVLALTIVVVLAAIELGYRGGRQRLRSTQGNTETEAQLSSTTGAHLALLAFIMAFSFSMAAGHYQDRRDLILEETTAISTAYIRADLMDSPEGPALQQLLREYTAIRAEAFTIEQAKSMVARSEKLQVEMWHQIKSLTQNHTPNILQSLLIQSINAVFDVHDKRVAAGLKNRVPPSLWVVLAALLTLSMLGIGYFSGTKGNRNTVASTGLALSFSLVLFLIADLDRPTSGLVMADRSAIEELDQRLNPL